LVTLAAALNLLAAPLAPAALAGEKALPPAFGKELVPDQGITGTESKAADLEGLRDEAEEERASRPARRTGGVQRGKRIRIQLDGAVDGGGGDDEDGDF